VKISEVDMPYHEREGESKLHVVRDGTRFLKVILEAAVSLPAMRPLEILSVLFFLAAPRSMASPAIFYLPARLRFGMDDLSFSRPPIFRNGGCSLLRRQFACRPDHSDRAVR